jgi:hypothetical protein
LGFSLNDEGEIEIVLDKRSYISLLLIIILSLFVLSTYVVSLNNFIPTAHVSAYDYGPPPPLPPIPPFGPPVAFLGLEKDFYVFVNETAFFDGSRSYDSDGQIVSYHWDFGDGNNGTGINITHTYTPTPQE